MRSPPILNVTLTEQWTTAESRKTWQTLSQNYLNGVRDVAKASKTRIQRTCWDVSATSFSVKIMLSRLTPRRTPPLSLTGCIWREFHHRRLPLITPVDLQIMRRRVTFASSIKKPLPLPALTPLITLFVDQVAQAERHCTRTTAQVA